ncbi:MAG: hypothetical protein ACXU82_03780 [Caulobacteraceae bacterium]
MPLDPERLKIAMAAIAGGVIFGLYAFATLLLAGQPPTRQDWIKAAINTICAIVVGVIVGYFAGPSIAALLPWASVRQPMTIGLIIGVFCWELLPIVIAFAKRWTTNKFAGEAP